MTNHTAKTINIGLLLNRRRTLAMLGGAAALAASGKLDAANCVSLAGAQTEGPYWVEENLNRSDIRTDPSDGTIRPGVLLALSINLVNESGSTCVPLAGAKVDIWHCDAGGIYSDEAANNSKGRKFLRGYQVSDDNGQVNFVTIYPGWYSGRTVHIHVRIRTYQGATQLGELIAQIFFDDTLTDTVFQNAPYNSRPNRDTRNSTDMVLTGTKNGAVIYADTVQTAAGYAATATIGVNLKTAAASVPVISQAGVVNGASFQDGIQPGSWVAIFGQNLAAGTRALTGSDLVDGSMPTSLGGVGVSIDGKAAFLYYVSPAQINVLAPADSNLGSVPVTVTTSAGTSAPVNANLAAASPGLFSSNGAVAAVRSDGAVIDGTNAMARPGDALQLFGTGFGPTSPAIAPGVVFQGSAPTAATPTVTIGNVRASVTYSGLTATGLYQINIIVPALSNGIYAVSASVYGVSSQRGVTLKLQN
jgi:uncharacterized protein (TIGR03437 family)